MPEVVRGSRPSLQVDSPQQSDRRVGFAADVVNTRSHESGPASPSIGIGRRSTDKTRRLSRDHSRDKDDDAAAYYDSRAATKREFKRRASTLQEYYQEHPEYLPQLPFTLRRGWKRWKLGFTIVLMVADACIVPIALYYAMAFGGNVAGWIIFAVIATIWGGPTYVEFAVRSWRLIKKEDFYRPLGQSSRWKFDITHYVFILTIAAVTALLVVGSAPHYVFLRVLSMPGPAILYTLCGPLLMQTTYHLAGWKAPFRLSSTAKGEKVNPGAYYFLEDVVAVTGGAGRPFREALASRYDASPKFRKMLLDQSLFWSIPGLLVAIACTVVVVISSIPEPVSYGLGKYIRNLFRFNTNISQDGAYLLYGLGSGLLSACPGFEETCTVSVRCGSWTLVTKFDDTRATFYLDIMEHCQEPEHIANCMTSAGGMSSIVLIPCNLVLYETCRPCGHWFVQQIHRLLSRRSRIANGM